MDEQRIAVVTGGNRGIGLEICRQLARLGLKVVLAARVEEKAREAAAGIEGDVLPFHLDVTHPAEVGRLAGFLERELGGVDVLVNNAGVFLDHHFGGLTVPLDAVHESLEVNVVGPWALSQAVVPMMKKRRYGRIVNVSSGLGAMSEMMGGYASYRVSKLALNGLTRILADELHGTNILVNTMCPGWVQTEMGGVGAPRSVEKGADTVVWLATLPDGGPTGGFFRDRRQIPW
ncbi:MAG TPA: SDR family oxidoreductase [Thermoanaerobaculia bacterium]|jgi:NAD(P)-dependent dehydrogenase (short-subunit alcohol dehydrogenase family)|nr:SDR family oxidoreductase [Thermoanaerobaculia bacterium]